MHRVRTRINFNITNNFKMKRKLQLLFNENRLTLMLLVGLFFSLNSMNAQTTLLTDFYNRDVLSPGGTPARTYTSTLGVGGTGSIATVASATAPATINDINSENDYRLRVSGGASVGTDLVMSSMSGIAGYNAILNANTQPIVWSFNIRHNRNTATMSGFAPGKYGVAAIIACDNINPMDINAKGYALVMGNVAGTPGSTYDLVSFTGGIMDSGTAAPYVSTTTSIITGMGLAGTRDVLSVKITYNPANNSWSMLQKDDPSPAVGTAAIYNDPAFATFVCGAGETTDTAGFVASSLPNFGFLLNHGATAVSLTLDHFKVVKGLASLSSFYLLANTDCTNLNNWGANTDGTGAHPGSFSSDNQTFKIFTNGALIESDWSVSGSASSVVLGDGTTATSLTIPSTVGFTGVLNVSANANLTVSSLTSNFTINTIDSNSTVTFDGADTQSIPAANYGNLNILTQGSNGADASGVISVLGNFNIAAGSILNMGPSKLGAVNTLTGAGILKTKNPNSTALPAGIEWPFDIYYNYTSANSTQSIAGGTYKSLDTTGAPTGSPRIFNSDISVSGAFVTGLGLMTATNRITLNGTSSQVLQPNFPNATAVIITNTSVEGVILSENEIIPDTTNLELAGNLNASFNENMGTISLIDNSVITLGSTPHNLVFTSSSAINPGPADFWIPGKTLTIKGWTGTAGLSGTGGKLFVGTDGTGLLQSQLDQITFEGFSGATILATTGEVVPVTALSTVNNQLNNLSYSPNPVVDKLTIANSEKITQINVYNLVGQKVMSLLPNQLSTSLDMSNLNSSVYMVEVISDAKKASVKVIKR